MISNDITNETDYRRLVEKRFTQFFDALEAADDDGTLEVEYQDNALSIQLPSGKQWLLSMHTASRQIWLASPISGGLHFTYDALKEDWVLPDGRMLQSVLSSELQAFANLAIA